MKKLTGDPKIDFPEIYDDEDDNFENEDEVYKRYNSYLNEVEKSNEYQKKIFIEELIENVDYNKDAITDKRAKKGIIEKFFDLFK